MGYRYEKDELLLLQVSLLKNTVKAFKDSGLPGSLFAIGSILSDRFDHVSDIDLVYIGQVDKNAHAFKQHLSQVHNKTFDIAFIEASEVKAWLETDDYNFLFLRQLNFEHKLLGGPDFQIPQFKYADDAYAKITKLRIHEIYSRICKRRLTNSVDGFFDKKFTAEGKEWVSFKDLLGLYLTIGDHLLISRGIDSYSKWELFEALSSLEQDSLFKYFKLCHEVYTTFGRYVPVTEVGDLDRFKPLIRDLDEVILDPRFLP